MPIVRTLLPRILRLVGIDDVDRLRDTLFNLKCETEIGEDGTIAIEVQSDRIDMFSTEGVAYAAKLYLGLEKPKMFNVTSIDFDVYVEPPIKRPYIAVAAVRNVEMDEYILKELIEFQERLHTTFGRNRRKVAIGIHDLDKLPSKTLRYTYVDINREKMIPLHTSEAMTIRDVLNRLDQGKLYGNISLDGNMHPAIFSGNEIISLPPVINSDITRLEPSTRNILIDVTGVDINAIKIVLNAIIHSLIFYGGSIIGARIIYPNYIDYTPDLTWRKRSINTEYASKWLGMEKREIVLRARDALMRMGYIVEKVDEYSIDVLVPPYRADILHQVDVIEDIAIGIGYDALGVEVIPPIYRYGVDRYRIVSNIVRDVLIGLGYTEINTLTILSSKILDLIQQGEYLRIVNPISSEIDAIRNSLIPSILMVLRESQHMPLPIKIFEVGEVVTKCLECYNRWRNELRCAFALMDSEIRFEDVHADLFVVLRELGIENISIHPCSNPIYISGRCGYIEMNNRVIAIFGEVNPEILDKLHIENPIAIAELYLEPIIDILYGR